MSSRKATTAFLSTLLEEKLDPHNDTRIYWAKEVTFDFGSEEQKRVDYMLFQPVNNSISGIEKGDVYCYEIKSSVPDFNSGHGHNFLGDLNYYVMPEQVYEQVKDNIGFFIGVLTEKDGILTTAKKARRVNRMRPLSECLLMMWRSSRREVVNLRKKDKQIDEEKCQKARTQNKKSYTTKECAGCVHDGCCSYFDEEYSHLSDIEKFQECCCGCPCGDGCECNRGCGCQNYEEEENHTDWGQIFPQ